MIVHNAVKLEISSFVMNFNRGGYFQGVVGSAYGCIVEKSKVAKIQKLIWGILRVQ